MGKIFVIGMGPGSAKQMTAAAQKALEQSDVLCGYKAYLSLLGERYRTKECFATAMTQELERCEKAIELAMQGKTVAMLCSGDAGIYGMAGPVMELAQEKNVEIEVIPGVTAASSGGALLGAPLMNDFCVISLSDYLTPWAMIEQRLMAAAEGDFAIVLYNPRSRKRPDHLLRACEILLREKSGDTVCGWVRNIGREGQEIHLTTLERLKEEQLDMFCTVFIGNAKTRIIDGRMVTPRGYPIDGRKILLFGGTLEGRILARKLTEAGHEVTVSTATAIGAEELRHIPCKVRTGRLDAEQMEALLDGFDLVIDATHPYAAEASANIRLACARKHIRLRRVLRDAAEGEMLPGARAAGKGLGESDPGENAPGESKLIHVPDAKAAAEFLAERSGNILLTTGSKDLSCYCGLDPERLYPRILPVHESLDACEKMHIPHRNIIAMQGPFSTECNIALIRQYQIRYLVTKDGGREGGFGQKREAALRTGIPMILIDRPEERPQTEAAHAAEDYAANDHEAHDHAANDQAVSMEMLLKELENTL